MTSLTALSTPLPIWLIGPSSPIVAITAVIASSSGTPAATRAPKAINRMISVIGSDVTSAFPKSSLILSSSSLLMLASPISPMLKLGWAACAAATASSGAAIRVATWSSSPTSSNRSSAERPSVEICPRLRGV